MKALFRLYPMHEWEANTMVATQYRIVAAAAAAAVAVALSYRVHTVEEKDFHTQTKGT
jgi:hypothetical protein